MSFTPRKLPQQDRSRATCATILEAAARIIARDGLAGFSTNAVAKRAGVSIGSLYQYYPNKDALMVALIDRQQQQQLDSLMVAASQVDASASLEAVVRTLVRGAMQHHRDHDLLASAIDHEEARLPVDALVGRYLDQGGALVGVMLARFAHQIQPIDPARAARTLPALVRAVTDAWANQSPPQLEVAEDEAVKAVLGYLR